MLHRIIRCLFVIVLACLPLLVLAATATTPSPSALSFTPPNTDFSVALLGMIFGSMPPVLTPNQAGGMIPAMFGIFNLAVLTLGGIILMYTLIVSTVNTAHEGEVLGKRWSSIWIPLRQVLAFGLLVPMSSGYCLMQVFIMWIVLQGVGAADALWSVSLVYLRDGGYIVSSPLSNQDFTKLYTQHDLPMMKDVAAPMLQDLVCMEGLRVGLNVAGENGNTAHATAAANVALFNQQSTELQAQLNAMPAATLGNTGLLASYLLTTNIPKSAIPGLTVGPNNGVGNLAKLNSLIAAIPYPVPVSAADQATAQSSSNVPNVPDFISTATFTNGTTQLLPDPGQSGAGANPLQNAFGGICGQITWQTLSSSDIAAITQATAAAGAGTVFGIPTSFNISSGNNQTTGALGEDTAAKAAAIGALISSSRQTAILAMYNDLADSARTIVANAAGGLATGGQPGSSLGMWGSPPAGASGSVNSGLGGGSVGSNAPNPLAYRPWNSSATGSAANLAAGPLMQGNELYNAVQVYNAIMQPALSALLNQANNTSWIDNSISQGWITAGSYFFDMANLNQTQGQILRDAAKVTVSKPTAPLTVNQPQGAPAGTYPVQLTSKAYPNGTTINVPVNPPNTTDPLENDMEAWNAFTQTAGTYTANPTGIAALKNVQEYQLMGTQPYTADFNQYLTQAAGYYPPDVLGNALNVNVPFDFNFAIIPPMAPVDCWGTFCIGGAIENIVIIFINLLIPAINQFFDVVQALLIPFTAAGTFFVNTMILGALQTGMHPILALAAGGNEFLTDAGLAFTAVAVANVTAGLVEGVLIPLMDFLNPFFLMLIGMLLTYGFLFAFWAPLVPFIIFFMAALGWFVCVIEAVTAAPLVALGLAHPEGDPILGKADPAVCMITNVFLRPTFILLGYIFGFILSFVGIILFNQGFGYIINAIVQNVTGFGSFFAPFVLAGIYIYVYLDLVSKTFEMIHTLPDRALGWVGCQGAGPQSFKESGAGMKSQVEGSAKGAEGMAQKGIGGAQGAGKSMKGGGGGGGKTEGKGGGDEGGDMGGGESPGGGAAVSAA